MLIRRGIQTDRLCRPLGAAPGHHICDVITYVMSQLYDAGCAVGQEVSER